MYTQIKPEEITEILRDEPVVAIDTETAGLNWQKDRLLFLQFSCKKGEAYLVSIKFFSPAVDEILKNPNIGKVFHSAVFDVLFLRKAGYTVNNIMFDTKIAAYLMDNTQDNGLKALARTYLRIKDVLDYKDVVPKAARAKKGELPPKTPTLEDVPMEKVLAYACADADHTFQLYTLFAPEIQRHNFDDLMQQELSVQNNLIDMTMNGCKLDVNLIDNLRCDTQKKHISLKKDIGVILGESIDINSSKQLGTALYDNLGLPVVGISATTGVPSTDSKCLTALMHDHKVIPMLLAYKQYEKLLSTYLEPIPMLVDNNDCLHGRFNQCITDTGRLSSSDPNLQNIPVKTEIGKAFRNCFISRFPGGKLLVADYNQIEIRMLAHLSKDKLILNGLKNGLDMHSLTASLLLNIPIEEVTKEQRKLFKTIDFGIIYGMSAKKLSVDAHITYEEAEKHIDCFFDTYFGVKEYREKCVQEVDTCGYVKTISGRRLYISKDKYVGTRALNYPIQGSAAEVIKQAMIKTSDWITKEGLSTLPILQVHDELVFDVPKDEQKLVAMKIPQLMSNVIKLSADFPVDSYMVDSWGKAK